MITFKRHQLFLTGVGLICFIYVLSKLIFLLGSATTEGICIEYDVIYPEGKLRDPDHFFPLIDYRVDGKNYRINGVENQKLDVNEKVTVIYKKSEPSTAFPFSFFGFWYYGILYSALSVILLTITCYGIFDKGQIIRIRIPFKKTISLPEKTGNSGEK
jgi:hypothetical protein